MLFHAYVKPGASSSRSLEEVADSITPVDWAAVVAAIVAVGVSANRLGVILDVALSTVQGWQKGSVPNADAGRKLLAIWSNVTGVPEYRPPTKRTN